MAARGPFGRLRAGTKTSSATSIPSGAGQRSSAKAAGAWWAESAAENDPIYCRPIGYPTPAKKCMPNVEPPALQEHMSMDLVASPYERQLHVPAPVEWGHTLRSVQGTNVHTLLIMRSKAEYYLDGDRTES